MQKKSLCFTALSKAFFSPATTSSLSSWEYVIWAFCQIRDRNGCRDTDTLIQPLQRFPGSSLGSLLSVRFVQSISSGEARWFYSERLLLSSLLTLSPAMSSDIGKRVVAAFSYFRWTYKQVAKIWTRPTYMAIVHAPFPDSTLETWLETKGRQPITALNVGYVCFCKPRICLSKVFNKYQVLAHNTCSVTPYMAGDVPTLFVSTSVAGNCPESSLKTSSGFTLELWSLAWQPHHQ